MIAEVYWFRLKSRMVRDPKVPINQKIKELKNKRTEKDEFIYAELHQQLHDQAYRSH